MGKFKVNNEGYYGEFGGAYIPEMLQGVIAELREQYNDIMEDETFKAELDQLLRDYAGRPSSLYHSKALSERYGCKVYLKREDLNHTGAHKINNALGQALLAKHMGKTHIIAETGAGQHGVATATVCALMGMKCTIFMGAMDVERQRVNVERMRMLGAEVVAVESGGRALKDAVDEALVYWCGHKECYYLIGSTVGPHPYPDMVARFQSVISKEIRRQLAEKENGRDYPDVLIACVGGGSNASGTIYDYLDDDRVRMVFAEGGGDGADTDRTAATVTIGKPGIIHGFRTLVMMDDEGNAKEPYSISPGLDYPGVGPLHAQIAAEGRATVYAITDREALDAAFRLTRMEGIIPALESSHALAALEKETFKPTDIVVVTVSGRGDKDVPTYLKHFKG